MGYHELPITARAFRAAAIAMAPGCVSQWFFLSLFNDACQQGVKKERASAPLAPGRGAA